MAQENFGQPGKNPEEEPRENKPSSQNRVQEFDLSARDPTHSTRTAENPDGEFTDIFLAGDDALVESKLKEIHINAKPIDLAETTPHSALGTDSDGTPHASKFDEGPMNYGGFESAAFTNQLKSEADSSSETNSVSENAKSNDTWQEDPNENEFSKFYSTLYTSENNGHPVVGAFILKHEEEKTEFLLAHPPELDVKNLKTDAELSAGYGTCCYSTERDHTAELQSSLHVLAELALGSRKRNSMVDFVHFVLPTKSGKVLFGTSYVLQEVEEPEATEEPQAEPQPQPSGEAGAEAEAEAKPAEDATSDTKPAENEPAKELEKPKEPEKPNPQAQPSEKAEGAPGETQADPNTGKAPDSGEQAETPGEGAQKEPEPEKPDLAKRKYFAVCLVYKVPFFGAIGSRLEYVAQTYFDAKNFDDHSLLLSLVNHINHNKVEDVSSDHAQWSYESLFFNLEYHFKPFSLSLSYSKCTHTAGALLFLLKSVLTEQRILVYSECAARTSTCILSFLTMIPCANAFNFNSTAFGSLWFNWKKYGFPLDIFRTNNPVYPYFTEAMAPLLDGAAGYLIGVTDLAVVEKLKNPPALIFDMEYEVIKLKTRDLLGFYAPSFYEITFFNDFELFEEFDIEDDPLKDVIEVSENIFHVVGDYLARAPSVILELGGRASKLYHKGRSFTSRRHKESYLRLFDVYFPGALPRFLRFTKKTLSAKKDKAPPADPQPAEGAEKNTEQPKPKKADPIEDQRMDWDKLIFQTMLEKEEEEEEEPEDNDPKNPETGEPVFTFSGAFDKMRRRSHKYRYLGYIPDLQPGAVNDRTKEVEYAIFTRIQPLRDFLLKFIKAVAYAGGKGRRAYQLVMDFTFNLDSVIDFNNPVDGAYVIRGSKFLRGSMQEPEEEEPLFQPAEPQRKRYLMEGDEEVVVKLPSMLATFILELQNNHSIDFIELWIQTQNFREFYRNHNLEVFNEPVFYLAQNLAKYTYPNGDFYVGELVDMLREGKGSYVAMDGSRYDGGWKSDRRHGKGTLITSEVKYTGRRGARAGDWFNNKKHGFGRLETRTHTYVGDFRHNKYHGNVGGGQPQGTMVFKDGVKLKGEFRAGSFEGKGIMTMPNGSVRMGNFKNGVIRGVCSVIDRDGKVFVGQLFGDLFHGKGVLKYNKQTSFEGFWAKGRRVKQGTIVNNVAGAVMKVEAVWDDDEMLMDDVMVTFPNGFKYNGSIRYYPAETTDLESVRAELGALEPRVSAEDAQRFVAAFAALSNRLLPHGHAICKDTDGGVYDGDYAYGARHGRASHVFPSGVIYRGSYYLGQLHGSAEVLLPSGRTVQVEFDKGEMVSGPADAEAETIARALATRGGTFDREFAAYQLDSLVHVMKSEGTFNAEGAEAARAA